MAPVAHNLLGYFYREDHKISNGLCGSRLNNMCGIPLFEDCNTKRGLLDTVSAKPRVDEGHRGLQYGTEQIDNSPRARGMKDPFHEKS